LVLQLAVIKDNNKSLRLSTQRRPIAVDNQTVLALISLLKHFHGELIMQLVENGKLNL
jgi:CubicO group peptidase (beta-lactamase class C family)